jgi:hypothetical protein
VRAVSYANAPYVVYVVPCIGWLVGSIWVVVLEVVAIRETHRVRTEIAVVAALGHRVLFVLVIVGLYAALIGLFIASAPFGQ